jgi:hypothetical protein
MRSRFEPSEEPKPQALETEEDLHEILNIALSKGGDEHHSLRERLRTSAAELNISDEALDQAVEQYSKDKAWRMEQLRLETKAKSSFMGHLFTYLAVNLGLLFIDFLGDGRINWAWWPILGWGIAIALHFITVYIQKDYSGDDDDEDDDDDDEEERRERARRRRRLARRRRSLRDD